ncbi:major facilitator superfamily multidrug-resistance, DHA1 sub-family [Collybia nuda]|uniref:Major facilitator superfamily multidrug-resistance, DHA1 sub-family n=1 Tax=Collybia nuda TaxID=64659 RepID=A0A9P6CJ87_9AGAR|nr:major facilitator superfamily multidrug-resistance, DHA1 sub-family [Collybia nuda]
MYETDEEILHESREEETTITKRTPLPAFQLFIVYLIQFAEPITATVIYPFINQFVQETGVTQGDERRTGYYAGIIESIFFITEAITVFQWGWLSDRLGRRPVLLLGPIGLSIGMLSFGFTNTFWVLVVSRCIQGIFNGNIGVSKSVIAEITDATNIGDAFAYISLMWTVGSTIGPILGGLLSRPATTWPDTFGSIALFKKYPYFLPCAVAASLAFLAGAVAFIGLKETLPSAVAKQEAKKHAKNLKKSDPDPATSLLTHNNDTNYGTTRIESDYSPIESGTTTPNSTFEKPPPLSALLVPEVVISVGTYMLLCFIDMSAQVLRPLVYSTSIANGGLGFDPYRIGSIMGTWGVINAILQVVFLGKVIRRFGPRNMHILSQFSHLISTALYPLLGYFVRQSGTVDAKVWTVIIIQLIFQITNNMAYTSIMILIIDSAPNRASLGATNGMAQAVGCFMRSIAPSAASSLFSISLQKQLAGGNMVFIVLTGVSLLGIRAALLLPKKLRNEKH